MTAASQSAEQRRLHDLVAQVPAGRVVTLGILAQHLLLPQRRVAHMLSLLDEQTRRSWPWWRVVADGGAIGRHPFRDEQMVRLRAEGVPVAPVGIVRELAERRWVAFGQGPRPRPAPNGTPPTEPDPPRSRARGIKHHT